MAMEHKLGIDWEHGQDEKDELNSSLQTDMMLDGYDEAQTVHGRSILDNSDRSRSGSQVRGTLQEEYKLLSRKYSFSNPADYQE